MIHSRSPNPTRRAWLQAALAAGLPVVTGLSVPSPHAAGAEVVRIGLQKSSTLMILLKSRGTLEEALAPMRVEWADFTSGLPMLEALNVGAIDLAADVADAVPPFALAAGARLTYFGIETASPKAQAIVVPSKSGIASVAQLKGRRVAFARGAGAHYLLLAALAKQGLTIKDIEPAYLTPADGRAAFENGSVAAWATWDPYLAAVQSQAQARVLQDGTDLAAYRRFYLAATPFVQRHSEALATIYTELQRAGEWIKRYPQAAADWNAPLLGLDAPTMLAANERRSYKVRPVDADSLAEQQRIADAFTAAQILPRPVDMAGAPVWRPV